MSKLEDKVKAYKFSIIQDEKALGKDVMSSRWVYGTDCVNGFTGVY